MSSLFTGAGVALITPFTKDGQVNYKKLAELIEFQIANKVDAIIAAGTTGESATLTREERIEVIKFCIEVTHKSWNGNECHGDCGRTYKKILRIWSGCDYGGYSLL